jgi:hypothetical protein
MFWLWLAKLGLTHFICEISLPEWYAHDSNQYEGMVTLVSVPQLLQHLCESHSEVMVNLALILTLTIPTALC